MKCWDQSTIHKRNDRKSIQLILSRIGSLIIWLQLQRKVVHKAWRLGNALIKSIMLALQKAGCNINQLRENWMSVQGRRRSWNPSKMKMKEVRTYWISISEKVENQNWIICKTLLEIIISEVDWGVLTQPRTFEDLNRHCQNQEAKRTVMTNQVSTISRGRAKAQWLISKTSLIKIFEHQLHKEEEKEEGSFRRTMIIWYLPMGEIVEMKSTSASIRTPISDPSLIHWISWNKQRNAGMESSTQIWKSPWAQAR